MTLNKARGKVTIPVELRPSATASPKATRRTSSRNGNTLRIVHHRRGAWAPGVVAEMRGKATTDFSTDDLMDLQRGE